MDENDTSKIELDSIPMPSNSSSDQHFKDSIEQFDNSLNNFNNWTTCPNQPLSNNYQMPHFQGFPLRGNLSSFQPCHSRANDLSSSNTMSQSNWISDNNFQPPLNSFNCQKQISTIQAAKVRPTFPYMKPIRFVISNKSSGSSIISNALSSGNASYPSAVRDYIERAYAATDEKDRVKLETYLKHRVEPLIKSGAVYAVNWTNEPLPHEKNYEIRTSWTPVSELKRQQSGLNTFSSTSNKSPPKYGTGFNYKGSNLSKKVQKKSKKKLYALNHMSGTEPEIKISRSNWSMVDTSVDQKKSREIRFSNAEHGSSALLSSSSLRNGRSQLLEFYQDIRKSIVDETPREIIGTCMEVEKKFFRLTAAADPTQVRPISILVEALEMVKKNYKREKNYRYACDQLKSIRQDLMIQNIRNDFTVLVYESNARIALENKDREEFNQCQNQLKQLYVEVSNCINKWEFSSYRLLYYIYMKDILDISSLVDDVSLEANNDECMTFALNVWNAWSMSNYVRLFRLYAQAPKMTGYVMDMFIERERKGFCTSIFKAFRPEIAICTVASWLAFTEEEFKQWFAKLGIIIKTGENIDCRQFSNIVM